MCVHARVRAQASLFVCVFVIMCVRFEYVHENMRAYMCVQVCLYVYLCIFVRVYACVCIRQLRVPISDILSSVWCQAILAAHVPSLECDRFNAHMCKNLSMCTLNTRCPLISVTLFIFNDLRQYSCIQI